MPNTTLNTNQNTNRGRNSMEFTPIPVSYANLLPYLLDNAMMAITPAKVPQPPFFRGYESNATCAYHGGVLGHSIEHCMTLKRRVQGLIDTGWLKFEENRLLKPNINKQHHTWGNFGSCCYDSSGFSSLCHKPQLQC